MKMYYEKDVDLNILKNKTVAVIGYGSQGMAQSRNMHESGLNVVVGLRKDGSSWKKGKADGLTVMTVEEASEVADVIHILIPDRSEERRVGKECRYRWAPHHSKKNAQKTQRSPGSRPITFRQADPGGCQPHK